MSIADVAAPILKLLAWGNLAGGFAVAVYLYERGEGVLALGSVIAGAQLWALMAVSAATWDAVDRASR